MNVGIGTVAGSGAVPFLGIFDSNFWYCVFAVWSHCHILCSHGGLSLSLSGNFEAVEAHPGAVEAHP
jgi:hypothetical protein